MNEEFRDLRKRKNQEFDGEAHLTNAELDAVLNVVDAAEALSIIHKSNQLYDALGRLKALLRLPNPGQGSK